MKKILRFICTLLLIAFVVYIYARYVETNLLMVHYINVKDSRISLSDKDLKILQFSDMHISEYFDEKDIKKVVEKIND